MIVKTIRWKTCSFSRLVDYISRDAEHDESFAVLHNLRPGNLPSIAQQFRANDAYRKERANGVVLYHEILSVSDLDRDSVTPQILEDLCRHYLEIRAPNALAFAQPHFDKGHLHIHIGISGVEYKSRKTLRMNNAQFERIRRGLEKYQREHYGEELQHSFVYENKRLRAKENIERKRIEELEAIQKSKTNRHLEQEQTLPEPTPEEALLDDIPELEAEAAALEMEAQAEALRQEAELDAAHAEAEALHWQAEMEAQGERQAEEAARAAEIEAAEQEAARIAELEQIQAEAQRREQERGLEI